MNNKKHILCTITATLLMTASLSAQVGINNENPKATLDITSLTTDGSKAEGLLVPRMSAEELKTMTETSVGQDQNSMMVFVTGAFTDTANKVNEYELVDGAGYYYFDYKSGANASRWRKVSTSVGSSYTAGTGMFLDSNEFSRNGLQEIKTTDNSVNPTGQNTYGWRYVGMDATAYGTIGQYATDLSYNPISSNYGEATGIGYTYQQVIGAYNYLGSGATDAATKMGAKGRGSFTTGTLNQAVGVYSTAMGAANSAQDAGATAIGIANLAKGTYSTVLGAENKLEPANMPNKTERLGEVYVMGTQNHVKAIRSVVLGSGNGDTGANNAPSEVIGLQSVTIGRSNGNTGENGVVIGTKSQVSSLYGVALGYGLKVASQNSVAVGSLNTIDNTAEKTGTSNTKKRLFTVGNGTETASGGGGTTENRSDAFMVLRDGTTGIDIDNFEMDYASDNKGHIDGAKLQVNGLVQSRGINQQSPAAGTSTRVVVADANGVLKTKKAATINQFYAPSALLPTSNSDMPSYVTEAGGVYTVDLYSFYSQQFSSPVASSNASSSLETYTATELDYFVTYADQAVYTNIAISTDGKLTYQIDPSGAPSEKTYMNIVFKVK